MNINYKGNDIDFLQVCYPYLYMREGCRNVVYPDIYDNPTVGIGHLVTDADNLAIGDTISNERVQALFNSDYARLNIGPYAAEILSKSSYNMALAVSSFVWAHGAGDYRTSRLRSGLLAGTFDADTVQTYLHENWDIHKPKNKERNKADFAIGFSDTAWSPAFFLSQHKHLAGCFHAALIG